MSISVINFLKMCLREILQINSQTSMVVDLDHGTVYIKADVSEQCVLVDCRELFSFGSGSWYDGSDARDLMEQGQGKFIKCAMTLQTSIILERKRLADHLSTLDCVEKATPLKDVLLLLEDAGEADRGNYGKIASYFLNLFNK